MSRNSAKLLNDIIGNLIDAYGIDIVQQAVIKAKKAETLHSGTGFDFKATTNNRTRELPSERRGRVQRPSALDLTHQYAISSSKKQYLNLIAERFDRKQFLPSPADAREFLILSGERPSTMKDRSDAFKQVLAVLVRLPTERLEDIANSAAYSGPSQLSAISDAIGSIGQEIRQRREPS